MLICKKVTVPEESKMRGPGRQYDETARSDENAPWWIRGDSSSRRVRWGGGETPQSQGPAPSGPVSVLAWTPPTTYNDNVALDPARDLDYYEIYVRQDANFTDSDQPVIQVAAVAGGAFPGRADRHEVAGNGVHPRVDPVVAGR